MRVPFFHLFRTNPDGSVTPRTFVQICGIIVGPSMTFTPNVPFHGINITELAKYDLEVKQSDNILIVVGFY